MRNPMLDQLRSLSQPQNNWLLQMLSKTNNPQALLEFILSKNPQINELIKTYGNGDPKTAFYEYARQTNQSPDQIIELLKNHMKSSF